MNNIRKYIYMILVSLCVISCIDDDSFYDTKDYNEFSAELEENYNVVAFKDVLEINPNFTDKNTEKYSFVWRVHERNVQGEVPEYDTISTQQNLRYEVKLDPSSYYLEYVVEDKKAGYIKFFVSTLEVTTQTTQGFYLMKEVGGECDLDLYNDGVLMENIYSGVNGSRLEGNAVQLSYFAKLQYYNEETSELERNIKSLMILTDKHIAGTRISDLKTLMKDEDFFYNKEQKIAPQSFISFSSCISYVNEGKCYTLNTMMPTLGSYGMPVTASRDYKLSDHFAYYGYMYPPTYFDELTSSFCTIISFSNQFSDFSDDPSNSNPYKNLNSDILAMDHKVVNRDISGLALLKDKTSNKLSVYILDLTKSMFGRVNPVKDVIEVAEESQSTILNADSYAFNKQFNLLYYSVANKVYMYNIDTEQNQLIYTLAEGERVSYLENYLYNYTGDADNNFDKLIIASYKDDNYKVEFFDILAGKPTGEPNVAEGTGIVKDVRYTNPVITDYYVVY